VRGFFLKIFWVFLPKNGFDPEKNACHDDYSAHPEARFSSVFCPPVGSQGARKLLIIPVKPPIYGGSRQARKIIEIYACI
jgi:hypothetical protein